MHTCAGITAAYPNAATIIAWRTATAANTMNPPPAATTPLALRADPTQTAVDHQTLHAWYQNQVFLLRNAFLSLQGFYLNFKDRYHALPPRILLHPAIFPEIRQLAQAELDPSPADLSARSPDDDFGRKLWYINALANTAYRALWRDDLAGVERSLLVADSEVTSAEWYLLGLEVAVNYHTEAAAVTIVAEEGSAEALPPPYSEAVGEQTVAEWNASVAQFRGGASGDNVDG